MPEGLSIPRPRSKPTDPRAMAAADNFMATFSPVDRPAVVPTPTGGLQLEWHRHGIDLEVYVETNGRLSFWYEGAGIAEAVHRLVVR